jgi:hypothetical protein
VNGTYDATGGLAVGSNMRIDSVFIVGLKNAITFPSIGSVVGADGPDVVVDGVVATSGADVTVTSLDTSVCTASISGSQLTAVRVAEGTCTLVASQGATGDYAPAQSVTRTFQILGAATTPGAPTISGIGADVDGLEVSFVPPASDGGSPITNYEYSLDGGTTWVTPAPAATSSPLVVAGLASGTTYQVRLRAVNAEGTGTQSNLIEATTSAAPPAPPPAPAPAPAPDPTPQEPVRGEDGGLPEPGTSEVEVGGEREPVTTESTPDGGTTVTGDGFVFEVSPEPSGDAPGAGDEPDDPDSEGDPGDSTDEGEDADEAVGADAELVFTRGQAAQVRVEGFQPNSAVRLWLFSDPALLGEFQTDRLGSLEALTDAIGDDVTACRHTLYAEGTLTDGREVRLSLGVWVDADPYPFDDVAASSVHRRAIACLVDQSIVFGTDDGEYTPAGHTTRGQVASMFSRWFGLEAADGPTHPDAIDTTHAAAIAALVEAGVAQGFDADTFGPDLPVTRGQFASMLAALLDLPTVDTAAFSDAGDAHAGAIGALADAGSVTGFADGTFRPGDPITRAQAASIIVRQQLAMQ